MSKYTVWVKADVDFTIELNATDPMSAWKKVQDTALPKLLRDGPLSQKRSSGFNDYNTRVYGIMCDDDEA